MGQESQLLSVIDKQRCGQDHRLYLDEDSIIQHVATSSVETQQNQLNQGGISVTDARWKDHYNLQL